MFTRQAAQIETALRGSGVPDVSAKEMMQGIANCQSPLEHRGQVAFTHQPRDNSNLMMVQVAEGSPEFYLPPTVYLSQPQITVNIPPWQNVPWEPIPYPDHPEWQPIPYPELNFPPIVLNDAAVLAGGPIQAGPVTTPRVEAEAVESKSIDNEGDLLNGNQLVNFGQAVFHGPVHHRHNVVNNNVVNNNVVNRGPVINQNIVHNRHVHNHRGVNHGRHQHYGTNTFFGPVQFGGNVQIDADIFVGNQGPLNLQTQTVVTDVEWTGTELRKKSRLVKFIGSMQSESTATVVAGVSCPTQPVSGPASNFVDSP